MTTTAQTAHLLLKLSLERPLRSPLAENERVHRVPHAHEALLRAEQPVLDGKVVEPDNLGSGGGDAAGEVDEGHGRVVPAEAESVAGGAPVDCVDPAVAGKGERGEREGGREGGKM